MPNHRQKAIDIIVEQAKKGDMEALQDLIILLRPSKYSQKILSDIYISEFATDTQREFISSQITLFSKYKLRKQLGIPLALAGDFEALSEIVDMFRSRNRSGSDAQVAYDDEYSLPYGLSSRFVVDKELLDTLVTIFTSVKSSPEQKELIWSLKDIVVWCQWNKRQVVEKIAEEHTDEDGYKSTSYRQEIVDVVDERPTSFVDYLKSPRVHLK